MSLIKRQYRSGVIAILFGVLTLMVILGISLPVSAQTVTGTISGVVVDMAGQAVAGAPVTITDARTGSARSATSNQEGDFSFAALQPGVYTVKIERQGFRGLSRTNNILSANEHLALGKLALEVGALTETVTTVAEGVTVEAASSDLTGRLTSDQISLISTKGRDITSLLRLLPGVSYIDDVESVGDGFGTDLPNVSGQRGRSSIATVNGLNASEPSGSNKVSMTTNQDAIAEVKVLRNNYSPEFGNNGGAQINIVTKSGKKDYFGSAYYFLRNEALNANSFFNNRQGLPRARYRHNIWGFNGGGPVQIPWLFPNKEKKNLFFFYSLEKPHTITPSGAKFVTVPTELERNGDFSQSFTRQRQQLHGRSGKHHSSLCERADRQLPQLQRVVSASPHRSRTAANSVVRAGSVESEPAADAELRDAHGLVFAVGAARVERVELRRDALRSSQGACTLPPVLRRRDAGHNRLRERQPARSESGDW